MERSHKNKMHMIVKERLIKWRFVFMSENILTEVSLLFMHSHKHKIKSFSISCDFLLLRNIFQFIQDLFDVSKYLCVTECISFHSDTVFLSLLQNSGIPKKLKDLACHIGHLSFGRFLNLELLFSKTICPTILPYHRWAGKKRWIHAFLK